ncbi:MAG: gliding motility-associated C-terminal domain-containing protein [Saprospiraceae bacterium]
MKFFFTLFILVGFIVTLHAQEICDNGIDDDGDGLIDLNDVEDCICGIISSEIIGDFEEYSCCPELPTSNLNQVDIDCLNDGWIPATSNLGGADYYNTCGFLGFSLKVPLPIPSGGGAVGIYTGDIFESVGTCTGQTFLTGVNYSISLYIGFNDTLIAPPANLYYASPLNFEFNLYGNNSCDNLPASGDDCLDDMGQGWYILATIPVSGVMDSSWVYVSTSFIANGPAQAIAIGGSCDFVAANGYEHCYHFIDDIHITGEYQTLPLNIVTSYGDCTSGVFVEVPSEGGATYQWYYEGIAILGATDSNYEVPSDMQGSYTVMIDYGDHCETPYPIDVFFETEVLDVDGTVTNILCHGDGNGMIESSVTPGNNIPLDYAWSSTETDADISNLQPGTYGLTVTDSKGCYGSTSYMVTQPPVLVASLFIDVIGSDGLTYVEVGAFDGTPDYYYEWCNNETGDYTYVGPGPCWVLVTDANGCDTLINFEIESLLDIDYLVDYGTCADTCDSQIHLMVSGGQSPYAISWSNSETDSIITNLCNADYGYTVTDATGASGVGIIEVYDPGSHVAISAVYDSLICSDTLKNGIILSASGGIEPYEYAWSTGDTTGVIDSLGIGTFYVQVTDSVGCTAQDSFRVSLYVDPMFSVDILSASCGMNNGSISLSVDSIAAPYQLLWSTTDTMSMITNVGAGSYALTITDGHGCEHTYDYTVNSDSNLMLNYVKEENPCEGDSTATITLHVTGGTKPYSINWNDSETDSLRTNLATGTYSVTLTDANNCITTEEIEIVTLSAYELSATTEDIDCHGDSTGSIDLSVLPVGNYFYEWNNNSTTQDQTNLTKGTYNVTVTDLYGCTKTAEYELTEPEALSLSAEIDSLDCSGEPIAQISLTSTGGTGLHHYSWSTGDTTATISNLPAGDYTITLTDDRGCELIENYNIPAITPISLVVDWADISCHDADDGSISLMITGGTDPVFILWNDGNTDSERQNLAQGLYAVTVTDGNGCTQQDSVTITNPPILIIDILNILEPEDTGMGGEISVQATGGTPSYTYSWNDGNMDSLRINLGFGIYLLTVTDANGCTATQSWEFASDSLIYAYSETDNLCYGYCEGSIDLTIAGGVQPYEILWNDGNTDEDRTALCDGTYQAQITDASSNILSTEWVEISSPDSIEIDGIIYPVSCLDTDDAEIEVTVTGGTDPYNYTWQNSDHTGNHLTQLSPGEYGLIVSDGNQCTGRANYTIDDLMPLDMEVMGETLYCGETEGTITFTGENPNNYAIQLNGTTIAIENNTVSNLPEGSYDVDYIINPNCILNLGTVTIDLVPIQNFQLAPANQEVDKGTVVTLSIESNGLSQIADISWQSNNNWECLDQPCTSISITADADDTVQAQIIDTDGCEYYLTAQIKVKETTTTTTTIPNIFSPNQDGHNDVLEFELDPENQTLISAQVFDRWGNLVYDYPNSTKSSIWDGTKHHKSLNPGVYVYVARYKNGTETTTLYGDVTLVR